ncbi:MAG: hypothetical protein ABMB14_31390 [Myxococcota bacterium]
MIWLLYLVGSFDSRRGDPVPAARHDGDQGCLGVNCTGNGTLVDGLRVPVPGPVLAVTLSGALPDPAGR